MRQGLVRKGTFDGPEETPRELLTLSKAGYRLLRANRTRAARIRRSITASSSRAKPITMPISTRCTRKKQRAFKAKGGRPVRVLLDFELKKRINHDFAKFGTEARKEIAARHGLRVVRRKNSRS